AFQSSGCNLGFGTTREIYLRNVTAATTKLVTHAAGAPSTAADGDSITPRLATGGAYITFASTSQTLFARRPAGRPTYDIYRYTIATDTLQRANIGNVYPVTTWPTLTQYQPDISGDGSRVLYATYSPFQVANDRASNEDIFMYDFNTPGTTQLSVSNTGAQQQ